MDYRYLIFIFFLPVFSSGQNCIKGNCSNGYGQYRIQNYSNTDGHIYIGEFKGGKFDGYGALYDKGRCYFIGEFVNGKKNGLGARINHNDFQNIHEEYGYYQNDNLHGPVVILNRKSVNSDLTSNQFLAIASKNKIGEKIADISRGLSINIDNNHFKNTFIYVDDEKDYWAVRMGDVNRQIAFKRDFSSIRVGQFWKDSLVDGISLNKTSVEIVHSNPGEWTSCYTNWSGSGFLYSYLRKYQGTTLTETYGLGKKTSRVVSHVAEPKLPPFLTVENMYLSELNQNNLLEAGESGTIQFDLLNEGEGRAYNINISSLNKSNTEGLIIDNVGNIGVLNTGDRKTISIPLRTTHNLKTDKAEILIKIKESNGFDADPLLIRLETKELLPPKIEIVDYQFLSDNGLIQLGKKVKLKFVVQNLGLGKAEQVKVEIKLPSDVFAIDDKVYYFKVIEPNESKLIEFSFFTNKRFKAQKLEIVANLNERFGKYSLDRKMSADIAKSQADYISYEVISENDNGLKAPTIKKASLTSDVDKNIPVNEKVENRFALIVGNQDYNSFQPGLDNEQNVPFALNDARVFKDYAIQTLGVPRENLFFLENATSGELKQKVEVVSKILEKIGAKAELIFYYAGHGFPDEQTREPYIMPVDVSTSFLINALSLDDLYEKFSSTGAKQVTCFIDACFSGGARQNSLLVSRGVKVNPRLNYIPDNLVVFTASSNTQSALPLEKEQHGMFTYYTLKKLQETKGEVSYGDLHEYLKEQVSLKALRLKNAEQDPNIIFSPLISEQWKDLRF